MKHITVLVSGGGTNLQALIDAQARGELKNGAITAVISSKETAYALERAGAAGRMVFDMGRAVAGISEAVLPSVPVFPVHVWKKPEKCCRDKGVYL